MFGSFLKIAILVGLLFHSAAAESWFLANPEWTAEALKKAGFSKVQYGRTSVGGVLRGQTIGPLVIFSSNRPSLGVQALRRLQPIKQGKIVAVFGPNIELDFGDSMIKVDYDPRLPQQTIVMPERGPSVDSYRIIVSKGKRTSSKVVAMDLVLTLQNRAETSDRLAWIQLEHYRTLPNDQVSIELTVRLNTPENRQAVSKSVAEFAQERARLYGASVLEFRRVASSESVKWPNLTKLLETKHPSVKLLHEEPIQTPIFLEDFGQPNIPTLTLRASAISNNDLDSALADVLREMLRMGENK